MQVQQRIVFSKNNHDDMRAIKIFSGMARALYPAFPFLTYSISWPELLLNNHSQSLVLILVLLSINLDESFTKALQIFLLSIHSWLEASGNGSKIIFFNTRHRVH